jgi:hypothetical protein
VTTKSSQDYFTRRSERVERNWSKTLSPEVRDELIAYSSSPHQVRRRRVRTSTREEQERRLMQRLLAPPAQEIQQATTRAMILRANADRLRQGVLAPASSGKKWPASLPVVS